MNPEDILSKIKELPPMPQIAVKIIKILEDVDFSFAELVSLISKDVNITATILKLANSPLFSTKNEITNLTQAMSLLGVKNIKNIVISLSTKAIFEKGKIKLIDQKIWEHSVATAIYSRIISLKVNKAMAEETFLLGLLHTIGQIILSKNMQNYEEIVATAYNDSLDIYELEKDIYGFTSYSLGELVMKKWNMPDIYADVIRNIPTPFESSNEKLTSIVSLSKILVIEKGISITDYLDEDLKNKLLDKLSLNEEDIEELNFLFDEIYDSEKELFKL